MLKLDENGEIPGCFLGNNTNAVVTETTISPVDTHAKTFETNIKPNTTDSIPIDTNCVKSMVCFFSKNNPTKVPVLSPIGIVILSLSLISIAILRMRRAKFFNRKECSNSKLRT